MKMLVGSFVVLSLAMGTAVLGAAEDSIVGIASVIDGDTIEKFTRPAHSLVWHRRSRRQPTLRATNRRAMVLRAAIKLCSGGSDRVCDGTSQTARR